MRLTGIPPVMFLSGVFSHLHFEGSYKKWLTEMSKFKIMLFTSLKWLLTSPQQQKIINAQKGTWKNICWICSDVENIPSPHWELSGVTDKNHSCLGWDVRGEIFPPTGEPVLFRGTKLWKMSKSKPPALCPFFLDPVIVFSSYLKYPLWSHLSGLILFWTETH